MRAGPLPFWPQVNLQKVYFWFEHIVELAAYVSVDSGSRPLFSAALSLASAVFYRIRFSIGEIQGVKDLREESNPQNGFSSQTPFGPEV